MQEWFKNRTYDHATMIVILFTKHVFVSSRMVSLCSVYEDSTRVISQPRVIPRRTHDIAKNKKDSKVIRTPKLLNSLVDVLRVETMVLQAIGRDTCFRSGKLFLTRGTAHLRNRSPVVLPT